MLLLQVTSVDVTCCGVSYLIRLGCRMPEILFLSRTCPISLLSRLLSTTSSLPSLQQDIPLHRPLLLFSILSWLSATFGSTSFCNLCRHASSWDLTYSAVLPGSSLVCQSSSSKGGQIQ